MGDEDAPRGVSPRVVVMTGSRRGADGVTRASASAGASPTPTTPSRAETTTEARERPGISRFATDIICRKSVRARSPDRGRTPVARARRRRAPLAQPEEAAAASVLSRRLPLFLLLLIGPSLGALPRNSPKSPRRLRHGSPPVPPPRRLRRASPSSRRSGTPSPTGPHPIAASHDLPEPHHPHHTHHPHSSLCVLRSRPQALYIPRCTRKRRPTRRAPSQDRVHESPFERGEHGLHDELLEPLESFEVFGVADAPRLLRNLPRGTPLLSEESHRLERGFDVALRRAGSSSTTKASNSSRTRDSTEDTTAACHRRTSSCEPLTSSLSSYLWRGDSACLRSARQGRRGWTPPRAPRQPCRATRDTSCRVSHSRAATRPRGRQPRLAGDDGQHPPPWPTRGGHRRGEREGFARRRSVGGHAHDRTRAWRDVNNDDELTRTESGEERRG